MNTLSSLISDHTEAPNPVISATCPECDMATPIVVISVAQPWKLSLYHLRAWTMPLSPRSIIINPCYRNRPKPDAVQASINPCTSPGPYVGIEEK